MTEPMFTGRCGDNIWMYTMCFCGDMRQIDSKGYYLPHTNEKTGKLCPPEEYGDYIEQWSRRWLTGPKAKEPLPRQQ
jgi:hypothetical protein